MKKSIICIILILSTFLIACNSSPQTKNDQSSVNATKEILQMKHYKKDVKGINFDIDIVINDDIILTEDHLIRPVASLPVLDTEKLNQTFFKDKTIVDTWKNNHTNILGKKIVSINLFASDYSVLFFNDLDPFGVVFVNYNNNLDEHIRSSFYLSKLNPDYNADRYSLDKNLPFCTREDAFKDISSIMSSLGYDIGTNYKAYALDHKTLKKEEHVMTQDSLDDVSKHKASWTQDDDSYYFFIRPHFNNIPSTQRFLEPDISSHSLQDINCPLEILYTKEGIQTLRINKIFNLTATKEKITLAPFDKIIDCVANAYTNLIGEFTYKINKASLAYDVNVSKMADTYPVDPVWVFEVNRYYGDSEVPISKVEMFVNATTGKEVTYGK